ncbi:MAG: hypothetical protein HND46_19240 [Chloroflexi bacterium]|nr:hypothetical protein [Chloroflexota bacterium]
MEKASFYHHWRECRASLVTLNRMSELKRLIAWADKKGLTEVRNAYQVKLMDEERKLFRYRVRSPRHTTWAKRLHLLNTIISPTPRYPAKGAAAIYSSKKLRSLNRKPIV